MNNRHIINTICAAALRAADPKHAVTAFFNDHPINFKDESIDIVSIGKAAIAMHTAVQDLFGSSIQRSMIISNRGHSYEGTMYPNTVYYESDHPIPGLASASAGKKLLEFLYTSKTSNVIFLISGGGSALVTDPLHNIDLMDIQETTRQLLACGATIHEINTIRKHVDAIKGGGLLRVLPHNKKTLTLVLSDVVGDDLSIIASGPTYWDASTYHDADQILKKYGIAQSIPSSVRTVILDGMNGKISETLKQHDSHFKTSLHYLIGNLPISVNAAKHQAETLGFETSVLSYTQQGEAKAVGILLANTIQEHYISNPTSHRCVIIGGETTVTLHKEGNGKGGRNQELILAAGLECKHKDITFASFGTDGIDGPTDAAGAIYDNQVYTNMKKQGLSPIDYLSRHDSYTFFDKTNGLIKMGPTGTNVGDISLAFY